MGVHLRLVVCTGSEPAQKHIADQGEDAFSHTALRFSRIDLLIAGRSDTAGREHELARGCCWSLGSRLGLRVRAGPAGP